MAYPMIEQSDFAISTDQMIEVDRLMMEDYGIGLIQMMENAGRNLAELCRTQFLRSNPEGQSVLVLAGPGGNGGGALVAARRLANWGAKVSIVISEPEEKFTEVPKHQLQIARHMGLTVMDVETLAQLNTSYGLIVDGLIGYSLHGAPTGAAAQLIRWANTYGVPIVSLDAPSGLDAGTGASIGAVISAAATLTLALPKTGIIQSKNAKFVGELFCADIGVPPGLYGEPSLGLSVPRLFAANDIVRVKLASV